MRQKPGVPWDRGGTSSKGTLSDPETGRIPRSPPLASALHYAPSPISEVTMIRFVSWSHASLLLLALIPACGSDDSGGTASTQQLIATCRKTCSKEKECFGAEANFLDCDKMCSPDNIQKPSSP